MKSLLIASTLSLLVASSVVAADRKTEEALMIVGAAADLISTEIALGHGLVEINPLGQRRWQRVTLKAASTSLGIYVARKLEKHGHERIARVMRYIHIGTGFGAAAWNVQATIRWGE